MQKPQASRTWGWILTAAFILLIVVFIAKNHEWIQHPVPTPTTPATITAPTPTVTITAPAPTIITYHIKPGDVLTKIAKNSCHTVLELARTNKIQNPDIIIAGKTLTYVKVEPCSPESVKLKTFPEKHARRVQDGASREKLFPTDTAKASAPARTRAEIAHTLPNVVSAANCARVGSYIRDFAKRVMARAECIKTHYGKFIAEALLQDARITAIDVVSIILYESKGYPFAVSTARIPCLGLMQLQPPTAQQYGLEVTNIFDPRENIRTGVRVFSAYTYRYFGGNKDYGLAAYNMGPNNKLFRRPGFDPNSRDYVQNVKKIADVLSANHFAL